MGNEIYGINTGNNKVDLSELSNGVYYLKLCNELSVIKTEKSHSP
ncbi:MAG: hypothetical protein JST67_03945 [Bacteroidetes bacterium]|nr:hypothetical protein [Bacteroidota bacterium]